MCERQNIREAFLSLSAQIEYEDDILIAIDNHGTAVTSNRSSVHPICANRERERKRNV